MKSMNKYAYMMLGTGIGALLGMAASRRGGSMRQEMVSGAKNTAKKMNQMAMSVKDNLADRFN